MKIAGDIDLCEALPDMAEHVADWQAKVWRLSTEERDELEQECALQGIRALPRCDRRRSPRTFIWKAMANRAKQIVRRRIALKRSMQRPMQDWFPKPFCPDYERWLDADKCVRLSGRADLMELVFWMGYTMDEAAELMGVAQRTVYAWMAQGFSNVRRALEE